MLHRISLCLGLALVPGLLSAQPFIAVSTATQLQNAFATVTNGGVIEVAAGTYASPTGGFAILNPNKSFTVRAAAGATVALDGGGTRLVLRYMSTSTALQGAVTFEDLIFRNGRSTETARGGGITQEFGRAYFHRCVVENNSSTSGGGGYFGYNGAFSWWVDSIIRNNSSLGSGAGFRLDIGTTWMHRTTFFQNRNNVVGHANTAVGGAIHFYDAKATITSSRFENNQSVWAGGAVYGIGTFQTPYTTPKTDIFISNCTFLNNFLSFQTGSAPPSPGEGGAIHIENQVRLRLFHSRLLKNRAPIGGGVSLYRSTAIIEDSVLRGNQATDTALTSGFGGAIKGSSNDHPGDPNYPSANLEVRDTFIQGRYDGVTTVARAGGGIFMGGDTNRGYGIGGVTQGTLADSRARLLLERVILYDLDVTSSNGQGLGGAIQLAMADFDADDTLMAANDAQGATGGGGAIIMLQDTLATITNSALVGNFAGERGGGIFAKGVDLQISNSKFLGNTLTGNNLLGASLFTEPDSGGGGVPPIRMTGNISSNVFSSETGLPIFDSDNNTEPINDIRYNGNQYFSSAQNVADYGDGVYGSPIPFGIHSPTSLNSFVVVRPGAVPDTDKSQVDNATLGADPKIAFLQAAPSEELNQVAVGDAGVTTPVYLAWGSGGGAATVDAATVASIGFAVSAAGTHVLAVAPTTDTVTIGAGLTPFVALGASPDMVEAGDPSVLSWNATGGTFETLALDRGVLGSGATGAATVTPPITTTYHIYLATREGGDLEEVTVFVGELPGEIFVDGFESGNTSAWN